MHIDRVGVTVRRFFRLGVSLGLATLIGCSGGSAPGDGNAGVNAAQRACDGSCASANSFLTVADVEQIIAQAVTEAQAQGVAATIAVVDRVGNVLGVYRMDDTGLQNQFDRNTFTQARLGFPTVERAVAVNTNRGVQTGLDGLQTVFENQQGNRIVQDVVPDGLAAIAKAITGAYLSTEGMAFTTRTASQIVQEHFNPGELNTPGGPLFGVQFSQLPCSDIVNTIDEDATTANANGRFNRPGPKRSPLGLSADPGGFGIYKGGTPVGGIGVIADGLYSLDEVVSDNDQDLDETIAMAGLFGFAPPQNRRGDSITVAGKSFRYSDINFSDTRTAGQTAPALASLPGSTIQVFGYFQQRNNLNNMSPPIRRGTAFGQVESGIAPATDPAFAGLDAFMLVDAAGNNRFPAVAGVADSNLQNLNVAPLAQNEVETLLREALNIAFRGRAQIRRPFNSPIAVTVTVVDSKGNVSGALRTRDAPMFGTDVALQKARTAHFFSSARARELLSGAANDPTDGAGALRYLNNQSLTLIRNAMPPNAPTADHVNRQDTGRNPNDPQESRMQDYVDAAKALIGPNALEGGVAFADRSGGNLSRPFFPDGIRGTQNGPFSKPFERWSPFSTGLQLDLIYERIIQHVLYVVEGPPRPNAMPSIPDVVPDVSHNGCQGQADDPGTHRFGAGPLLLGFGVNLPAEIRNGIQIFPGSVPIYRLDANGNPHLIGGIGVSGDGVDQDDMIAFLGARNAGIQLQAANPGQEPARNAPREIWADRLQPGGPGTRLRYVQCPQQPFRDSDDQAVCGERGN